MCDVERILDATLASTMVAARVLERYEISASEKGEKVKELEDVLSLRENETLPESFAEWFANRLGLKIDRGKLKNIRERLQTVDPLSLTDRPRDACNTPLLSPLWILELMHRNGGEWKRYQELWKRSCSEKVDEGWSELLKQEFEREIWLPVQPLPRELTELLEILVLRKYGDASNNISYGEIGRQLVQMLDSAARFYSKLGSKKGIFETVNAIFASSLLLVPAWTGVRPPDTPLSAASVLLGSLSSLQDGFRIIALDINGIQDFVFAPVKESAASRLLRGRSLLVELIQFTASRLAIEMLGALAQFTKEGGSPTFITPPLDTHALKKFSELLGMWMSLQFMAKLWITVAASEKHDVKGALCPGEQLSAAFEELETALDVEKSRKQAWAVKWLSKLSEKGLRGFDTLTREPVLGDDPWIFEVSQNTDYAEQLAPGKLERGDLLSGLTHISLACGNVARNLVAIVSIYFFKEGKPSERDAKIFAEKFAKSLGKAGEKRLYAKRKVGELDIAFAPFCEIGAVHVLASHEPGVYQLQRNKTVATLLDFILGNMRSEVVESDYIHFEIRVVNALHDFLLSEELAEKFKNLGAEVGVSMLPFYTNTYHPVKREGGLIDLDEMPNIAVTFLDADGIGEITKGLSKVPIALVSFSEFLSLGFGAKAYACLLKRIADEEPKSIILYAGGDDVSVYGAWYDVIGLLKDISEEILGRFLNPLTASGGVSLADNKTPILHLATVARDAERRAKEEGKKRTERGFIHIQALTTEPLKLRGGALDLPKLASCLEEKSVKNLKNFKMLIYALAELADEASKLKREKLEEEIIMAKAKVVVGYKYLIARRHEDFNKLKHGLEKIGVQLPSLDSSQDEVVSRLTILKPLFDLLALRFREGV